MSREKASPSRQVTVVCGVVECQDKALIGRQVEGDHPAGLGGRWVLPGGVLEEGETLACLEQAGIRVLRTDQAGTVEVTTDGERYWVRTKASRSR